TVVAVIGDGALTGGMAWEALNNIAARKHLPLVIVVNDNGRSYSPTFGGLATHLSSLRMSRSYEHALEVIKTSLGKVPVVGSPIDDSLHRIERGLQDIFTPQALFEDLALKYVGPINAHVEGAVESALRRAKAFRGPVIVHV